jgi:lycopene cyclase domain-containing protein
MDAVDRYQYLLLMAACLVVTLPLEFAFGARVWRRPRRLFVALVPPVLVFAVWDVLAIAREHWSSPPRASHCAPAIRAVLHRVAGRSHNGVGGDTLARGQPYTIHRPVGSTGDALDGFRT